MQLTNLTIAYLAAELRPIVEGSIIRKVQELENGWLKVKLQTRQGTKDLIAAPDALFLTGYSIPAKKAGSGYGAYLRKMLSNKKIISLKQHGLDRIVVIELEGFFLIFELFAKGNVILADPKLEIVSVFRKEQWKDRTLKKGEQYRFPSSKGISPASLSEKALAALLSASDSDVVRTIVKEVNIAPVFAEDSCLKAVLDKGKPAKELQGGEIRALAAEIKGIYSVRPEKTAPALVEKQGQEVIVPIALKGQDAKIVRSFPSVNQAVDELFASRALEQGLGQEAKAVERKRAELEKSKEQQRAALETLQKKVEENAKKAGLIYANYSGLFELLNSLKGEKIQEKEVMYKIKKRFPFLKSADAKARKIVVSLEN